MNDAIDLQLLSLGITEPFDYEPGAPDPSWDLTQIADWYGTDKGTITHGYTKTYAELFKHLRDRPIRMLEIGVACGASLKTWSAYFQKAEIFGRDIKPACAGLCAGYPRVNIATVDARCTPLPGPWDIIIDDASHIPADIVAIWRNTWGELKTGGLYCIEDLQCIGAESYKLYFPDRADEDFDPLIFSTWLHELEARQDVVQPRRYGNLMVLEKK